MKTAVSIGLAVAAAVVGVVGSTAIDPNGAAAALAQVAKGAASPGGLVLGALATLAAMVALGRVLAAWAQSLPRRPRRRPAAAPAKAAAGARPARGGRVASA